MASVYYWIGFVTFWIIAAFAALFIWSGIIVFYRIGKERHWWVCMCIAWMKWDHGINLYKLTKLTEKEALWSLKMVRSAIESYPEKWRIGWERRFSRLEKEAIAYFNRP